MIARSGWRIRHNVECIRDESVDRVGDKQATHDYAEKYPDVSERLIGRLCQGICSDSDVLS